MARRFLQTVAFLASILLLQVICNNRVEWRRLPSSFTVPSLQQENATNDTVASFRLTTTNSTTHSHWWESLAVNASHIWKPMNYSWCIPQHSKRHAHHYENRARDVQRAKTVDGLVFVKSPKASSSTGAGISLRIATEVGRRLYNTSCTVNYTHPFAHFKGHGKRSPHSSLLWTTVREPAKRQLSIYEFFFVARKGLNSTSPQEVMDFLSTHKSGQFRYIAKKRWSMANLEHKSPQQRLALVQNLINFYHFIAITERMDESLTAMKLLFGLHHHDVIVLPSKAAFDPKTCRPINKISMTNEMKDFIQSNFTVDNIDYLLYEAANMSLDKTIAMLGREQFEQELKEHRRLQALAEKECMSGLLPCFKSTKSVDTRECYAGDSGCGYKCVDRVLRQDAERNMGLNETSIL